MAMARYLAVGAAFLASQPSLSMAFVPPRTAAVADRSAVACDNAVLDSLRSIFDRDESPSAKPAPGGGSPAARSLLLSLIDDERCFASEDGARRFAAACAPGVVYEDCAAPDPLVGREEVASHLAARARARGPGAGLRVDRISDGAAACGFAWTWTAGGEEGLRGTTFAALDGAGEIAYVREIPEPLWKPGDLTLEVLKAATKGATPKPPPEYAPRTPTKANEIAKYLFNEVQGSDSEEAMRFFSERIIYRDFNYEQVLRGKAEVKKFIDDFSFPGITFETQRFDDGETSTCFTWEVVLEGAPEGSAVKGISFYEVDPETGLITYVRDVPESAIKPPPLGKLARQFRPALGVFRPVAVGSREGGL